jgi:hypothetical protein
MQRYMLIAACVAGSVSLTSPATAVGERPYWPAFEYREVPQGCIKWNWQQLSYYNYCPKVYPGSRALRVRG